MYVSSFGPAHYEQYGKAFLESFLAHHDKLTLYVEEPIDFEHPNLEVRDYWKCYGAKEFDAISAFPAAQGDVWNEGKRNYRFDVHKFARKSFAQIDAASYHKHWLVWVDADTEFSGPLPDPVGHEFMLYMDRPSWHSCASYVAWNLNHPAAGEFFKRYWLLYITGTVFCLPEWHDSYVLDWLREQIKFESRNLAAGLELGAGPVNVFDKVFPMAHHKKGNLKNAD